MLRIGSKTKRARAIIGMNFIVLMLVPQAAAEEAQKKVHERCESASELRKGDVDLDEMFAGEHILIPRESDRPLIEDDYIRPFDFFPKSLGRLQGLGFVSMNDEPIADLKHGAYGSGFFFTPCHFLTNHHVAPGICEYAKTKKELDRCKGKDGVQEFVISSGPTSNGFKYRNLGYTKDTGIMGEGEYDWTVLTLKDPVISDDGAQVYFDTPFISKGEYDLVRRADPFRVVSFGYPRKFQRRNSFRVLGSATKVQFSRDTRTFKSSLRSKFGSPLCYAGSSGSPLLTFFDGLNDRKDPYVVGIRTVFRSREDYFQEEFVSMVEIIRAMYARYQKAGMDLFAELDASIEKNQCPPVGHVPVD